MNGLSVLLALIIILMLGYVIVTQMKTAPTPIHPPHLLHTAYPMYPRFPHRRRRRFHRRGGGGH